MTRGPMRIVVTGGAGYIGSVVTEELIAQGHSALVLDNLSKGHRDSVVEGAEFAQLDLRDGGEVVRALHDFGAEAVVHLAADSLVGESMTEPSKYYRNNVLGGLALLDAMREAEVLRLVFSSTAAVYGEPEEQPIRETARTQPTTSRTLSPTGTTALKPSTRAALAVSGMRRWTSYSKGASLESQSKHCSFSQRLLPVSSSCHGRVLAVLWRWSAATRARPPQRASARRPLSHSPM